MSASPASIAAARAAGGVVGVVVPAPGPPPAVRRLRAAGVMIAARSPEPGETATSSEDTCGQRCPVIPVTGASGCASGQAPTSIT